MYNHYQAYNSKKCNADAIKINIPVCSDHIRFIEHDTVKKSVTALLS